MIEFFEPTYGKFYVGQEANLGWEFLRLEEISAQLSEDKPISTDLRGAKGLAKDQLKACEAQGAMIDEDFTTSSSQSPVSSPPPPQSNDERDPSTPPAQESTPPPDTGSSAP